MNYARGTGASPEIRQHWVPLFERHGVDLVFEHHDHTLKRTKPLLGGKPALGGITYLGDGSWGVRVRKPRLLDPWMERTTGVNHLWRVRLSATSASCTAISSKGAVLDEVEIAPRP